jgi:hypothetical protein
MTVFVPGGVGRKAEPESFGRGEAFDPKRDFAFLGELDCVGGQIDSFERSSGPRLESA